MRKREDFKILNIGCGQNKIPHAWNIDADGKCLPDDVINIVKGLPYPNESFATVLCFHFIEHIPKKFHVKVLSEIHRVLEPAGAVFMSYPEFTKCAQNYISNFQGKRDFWEATIYGRQLNEFDAHCALMDTPLFEEQLKRIGFKVISGGSEPDEPYNTVLSLEKTAPQRTYEDILKEEIFS